jgi:hypothetical protein
MGVLNAAVLAEKASAQRPEPWSVTVVHPNTYRDPGSFRKLRQLAHCFAARSRWLLYQDRYSRSDRVMDHMLVAERRTRRDDGIDSADVGDGIESLGCRCTQRGAEFVSPAQVRIDHCNDRAAELRKSRDQVAPHLDSRTGYRDSNALHNSPPHLTWCLAWRERDVVRPAAAMGQPLAALLGER